MTLKEINPLRFFYCPEYSNQAFFDDKMKILLSFWALRKFLCKRETKQIRKQITNEVFRLENGGIHLPVLAVRYMLYDGMRTAGVNNGIRHRAY